MPEITTEVVDIALDIALLPVDQSGHVLLNDFPIDYRRHAADRYEIRRFHAGPFTGYIIDHIPGVGWEKRHRTPNGGVYPDVRAPRETAQEAILESLVRLANLDGLG
jgi:hypothetical protein